MKKKRSVSFKHLSKDAKRRQQLHKNATNQTGEKSRSDCVMFARAEGSASFVRTEKAIARTPFSKRMLAFILAIVFVLSVVPTAVFFHLRGKADDENNDLSPVKLQVMANGEVLPNQATIQPGNISENIDKVKVDGLPDGAEFVKAVLVDSDDIETEVKAVAGYGGSTYYSLDENADIGTLLQGGSNGSTIYLVYDTKYFIHTVQTGNGSFQFANAHKDGDKDYIWSQEDLEIKMIRPAEYYSIEEISYQSGSSRDTLEIKDSAVTIPSEKIQGDITVSFPFVRVNNYRIIDTSNLKGLGNGGLAETRGKSSLTSAEYSNYFRTRWAPTPAQWDESESKYNKTFYLYSNSSTGDSDFQLNMFRVNGEEIEVSRVDSTEGVTHTLSDGTVINIKLVGVKLGMYWLDNKPNALVIHDKDYDWNYNNGQYTAGRRNKDRAIYEITATNIHSDLNVEYNFKQRANRELIIKGLNGITETAHAREKLGDGAYEYYFEQSSSNVYSAYYNQRLNIPSANLYLYRVKPGYNPYTVFDNNETKLYYVGDDNVVTVQNNIVSGEVVGRPEEAIKNATAGIADNNESRFNKFDIAYRRWGSHSQMVTHFDNSDESNKYNGGDGSIWLRGDPFVLTEIGENNAPVWYGVALSQNPAKNQQLYLNASPYQYTVELDLDGGSFTDTETYKNDDSLVKEQNSHTIENPKTYLPEQEPTRDGGYVFEGWSLQKRDENGSYIDVDEDELYQKADQFTITADTLALINGDEKNDNQPIRFKAIWKQSAEATKTLVSVEIYQEVLENDYDETIGDKNYKLIHSSSSTQIPGRVVLLNSHKPEKAEYYEMRKGKYTISDDVEAKYTKLTTEAQKAGENDESNKLRICYDYKKDNLTVKKVVKGRPRTIDYSITIKLTPEEEGKSPISFEQAKNMLALSDNGSMIDRTTYLEYTKTFQKGDELIFSNIPYGWNYEVVEAAPVASGKITADDYTITYAPNADGKGRLTEDTTVTVTNTGKNPGIETDKKLTKTNADADTYKLDLSAWATGETLTQVTGESTALDIAIVVDQSGSMSKKDIDKQYIPTTKKRWSAQDIKDAYSANPQLKYYYMDDEGKPHEVKVRNGDYYSPYNNSPIPVAGTNGLITDPTDFATLVWHNDYSTNYYYKDKDDKNYYQVKYDTAGKNLQYYMRLHYTKNGRTVYISDGATDPTGIHGGGYATWGYSRPVGGIGIFGGIETSDSFTGTMYTKSNGPKTLYYGEDQIIGTASNSSSDILLRTELYTYEDVSRVQALKNSINKFLGTVAENAEAQGVDHRVALIGFAGNEVPGFSTDHAGFNYSGTNYSYDYVNTGLFVDGTFKSYKEITGYELLDSNQTAFINNHYFINYGGKYRPVEYSNGSWYVVPDDNASPAWHSVSVTRITSGNDNSSNRQYKFYTPVYASLDNNNNVNYYKKALQSVNDDGEVNPDLITETSMIGAYGGTYTSFGLAMANQIFANNPISEGENRKRIIIVFSDGVPGDGVATDDNPTGFDESIAMEAKADAAIAKSQYDASVYTVYLHGSQQVNGTDAIAVPFLTDVSSNKLHQLNPVYQSALDSNATYVYRDAEKSVSVKSKPAAYRKIINSDTGEPRGYSVYTPDAPAYVDDWYENYGGYYWIYYYGLYDIQTKEYVSEDDLVPGNQYYVGYYSKRSSRNTTNTNNYSFYEDHVWDDEVYTYDYLWYGSDGLLAFPKNDAGDSDNTHHQFYSLSEVEAGQSDINYYQETANADALLNSFVNITETLQLPTTTVTLDGNNSFMRDTITADFELPMTDDGEIDYNKISAKTVKAHSVDETTKTITWSTAESDMEDYPLVNEGENANFNISINPDTHLKTIEVWGFNYGENYTTDGVLGKKLVVTIEGITPAEGAVGYKYSNTDNSGIYKRNGEGVDPTQVAEFIPQGDTIDPLAAKFTLHYNGVNRIEGLKFPVIFKLTKKDGETPYSGTFGNYTFSSDGLLKTRMGDEESKIFDGIPANAILTVTVQDPDDATIYYQYAATDLDKTPQESMSVNGGDRSHTISTSITRDNVKGGTDAQDIHTREIEMSITDNRRSVEVTNKTDGSFGDQKKQFPVCLTLMNGEDEVNGTFLDTNGNIIEFHGGEAVINLAHNETKGVYIPAGYTVIVKDDTNPTPYWTTFKVVEDGDGAVTIQGEEGNYYAEARTSLDSGTNDKVTIIHHIDDPVPTGVSDSDDHNAFIYILAGAAVVSAGAGAAYVYRKKDEFVER